MPKLNSWTIISAIREGTFPLLLRHLWQLKTGWDPLVQERYVEHHFAHKIAVCVWILVCSVYGFVGGAIYNMHEVTPQTVKYVVLYLFVAVCILFTWKLIYINTTLGTSGPRTHRNVRIGKPLEHFLELTDTTLQGLCGRTEKDLSEWAVRILDHAALELVKHQEKEPKHKESLAYRVWLEDHLAEQKKFEHIHDSLQALGLVSEPVGFYKGRARNSSSGRPMTLVELPPQQ